MKQRDQRGYYRLPIRVPVFIKGIDVYGEEFFELTHTINVSASGACFLCQREVSQSADLYISIPAPVDTNESNGEQYEFKFPAKVVRIENGLGSVKKRVAVRFAKLLIEEDRKEV